MIPHQNVQNLMLRPDVVQAAAEGKFPRLSIHSIDEGIGLLTGVPAGDAATTARSRKARSTFSSTRS